MNDFGEHPFFDFSKVFTYRSWGDSDNLADILKRCLARFTIIPHINCCLKHLLLSRGDYPVKR